MSNPLYLDDRAGSLELVKYEPLTSTAELTRLDSADVMFCGNGPDDSTLLIGIEVKSIWDLLSSISTGRLQATQLPALLETYDVGWLLVYGAYGPGPGGRLDVYSSGRARGVRRGSRTVPYGYVEAFLCDVTALGIGVKNVGNAYAAAQWIGVQHRWWSKPWSKHHGLRTLDSSSTRGLLPGLDAQTRIRASVAAQLPGLGFERGVAAALHFPSIEAMVTADTASWERVPGVGRVIAKAVVESIRRR